MKKQHTYTLPIGYRMTREIENAHKPTAGVFLSDIRKSQDAGRARARLKVRSRKPVTLPKVGRE